MLYPLNIKRQMDPSWCHLHSSLQPRQYSPIWLSGIWILLCRSSTILRGIGILLCLDGMWILLCRWSKILCLWTFWFYLARHGKELRLTSFLVDCAVHQKNLLDWKLLDWNWILPWRPSKGLLEFEYNCAVHGRRICPCWHQNFLYRRKRRSKITEAEVTLGCLLS